MKDPSNKIRQWVYDVLVSGLSGTAADVINSGTVYADWYLPSKDELVEMFDAGVLTAGNEYWSSSEENASQAINVSNALLDQIQNKSSQYKVRQVRQISAASYSVGDTGPAGGTIFYVGGGYAYEAAYSDLSDAAWSNVTSAIGTTGTAIGTGSQNTQDIIAQVGHTASAADDCYNTGTTTPEIDTITLTGSSGRANISCNGVTKQVIFYSSLTSTAATFVTDHAAAYLAAGVTITSSGAVITFRSADNVAFSSAPAIANISGSLTYGGTAVPVYSFVPRSVTVSTGGHFVLIGEQSIVTEQSVKDAYITENDVTVEVWSQFTTGNDATYVPVNTIADSVLQLLRDRTSTTFISGFTIISLTLVTANTERFEFNNKTNIVKSIIIKIILEES